MCVYTNELMRRIFQKMWPEWIYLVYVGVSGEGLAIEGVGVGGEADDIHHSLSLILEDSAPISMHSFLFPQLSL